MSKRLDDWLAVLRTDCTDYDIAAGLGNGDIDRPEWLSVEEGIDATKIWDNETGESRQMGFTTLAHEGE